MFQYPPAVPDERSCRASFRFAVSNRMAVFQKSTCKNVETRHALSLHEIHDSQLLQPDIPVLDLHRRTDMHLHAQQAGEFPVHLIVVGHITHQHAVDIML